MFRVGEIEKYENYLSSVAEQNCKSIQDWQDEEIYSGGGRFDARRHKSAMELKDRYQLKLYHYTKAEDAILEKIKHYEARKQELQNQIILYENHNYKLRLKRAKNRLLWVKKTLFELNFKLTHLQSKISRYEYLCMKWTGIVEKILIASIAVEIWNEKHCVSAPKYGFGPDRDTTPFLHED